MLKKLWIKDGGHFFPSIFLSHSADRFRGEPFNVSESLGFPRNLCIRRGYQYFPLNFLCPSVPKKSNFQKIVAFKNDNQESNCSSMINITSLLRTALIYRNFWLRQKTLYQRVAKIVHKRKQWHFNTKRFGYVRRRFTKMFWSTVDKSGKK